MNASYHTVLDLHALRQAGVDPDSTQPREHAVRCTRCTSETWNQAGRCDAHYVAPAAARLTRA